MVFKSVTIPVILQVSTSFSFIKNIQPSLLLPRVIYMLDHSGLLKCCFLFYSCVAFRTMPDAWNKEVADTKTVGFIKNLRKIYFFFCLIIHDSRKSLVCLKDLWLWTFVLLVRIEFRWSWLWSVGGILLAGENRSTRRKTSLSATLSTANFKWTDRPGIEPDLRCERPVSDNLFYGTVLKTEINLFFI